MTVKAPTQYSYPHAAQGRIPRAYIDCKCGHRSWGSHFGHVQSADREDAWYQHRLHMDANCPERREPREGWGLSVQEAFDRIRKILDQVKV